MLNPDTRPVAIDHPILQVKHGVAQTARIKARSKTFHRTSAGKNGNGQGLLPVWVGR